MMAAMMAMVEWIQWLEKRDIPVKKFLVTILL
jgi:hypothetical protein